MRCPWITDSEPLMSETLDLVTPALQDTSTELARTAHQLDTSERRFTEFSPSNDGIKQYCGMYRVNTKQYCRLHLVNTKQYCGFHLVGARQCWNNAKHCCDSYFTDT